MSKVRKSLPAEIVSDALFGRWLRKQGLRLTPHRKAILEALRSSPAPLSAEALRRRVSKANLTTIYRTLDTFERANIVRKVGVDEERAQFELAFDHHHHIVCTSCEKIEEVRLNDKRLEEQALQTSRQFRSVQRHSLEFFGRCKQCIAKA